MIATSNDFTLILDGTSLPPKDIIGGKAWSLARMRAMGLPVPPAFVITTQTCRAYMASGQLPDELLREVDQGIAYLERETGRRFGGAALPLLVSVRSGAPISMPGMMDTVLNLGINNQAEQALAQETGNAAFARDTHRRFCEMFARIVLRAIVTELDRNAMPADWRATIAQAGNGAVPQAPREQLHAAIRAVFDSWNGRRAKRYREHHGINHEMGTAVTVQAMVFGNSDGQSGTGVLFSRNPLTGERKIYGEYLINAQGEDVVSGSHTPEPLSRLAELMPSVHAQLVTAAERLEKENRDVQDIEFTVERGRLYLLQCRSAKRSAEAAVRIATDLVSEGVLSEEQALARVSAEQVRMLLRPHLAQHAESTQLQALIVGEAASPGVGVGMVVTDADSAVALAAQGEHVILVRPTTSPEDIHGMLVAHAVITERGGATSHAAVVSRQLGIPCVVGCGDGALDGLQGMAVTVDGANGKIYVGALHVEQPSESNHRQLAQLTTWAITRAPIRVHALDDNIPADTLDLDTVKGGDDVAVTRNLLQGVKAASGSVLNTDAGVHAAMAAGVQTIFVRQVLPALLAACAASAKDR